MSFTSTHKDTQSLEISASKPLQRKIIHVDMDAFYASVEQRDNASLRGQAVIVGGRPNGRGVVAACSYEARAFGVKSAMPSAEAARRCPDAIFVKPRFAEYKQASRLIQGVFNEFTDLVEPLSLDEAYLDVSRNTLFEGSAYRLAREIKSLIWQRTQLVASAGVSYNKFLAKIASDFDKPDGLYCILPEDGEALKQWSEAELASEFGKSSAYYYKVARGIDHRPVRSSRIRKSLGSERTFGENLQTRSEMLDVLIKLSETLLAELVEKQMTATTITIKVRFADFRTYTRAHTELKVRLDGSVVKRILPVLLDRALQAGARDAKERHIIDDYGSINRKSGIRLLGVSFRGLREDDIAVPVQMEIELVPEFVTEVIPERKP